VARVFYEHRLVSLGNLEAAVSLLLSTPPEGSNFYPNALRAVVLSSAVSQSLHELAVKVSSHKTPLFSTVYLFLCNIQILITIRGQSNERPACLFIFRRMVFCMRAYFDHWSI
jgi:hypothetical protein